MDFWGIKGNKSVCICAMQQKEGSMTTTDRTLEKKLFKSLAQFLIELDFSCFVVVES